MKEQDEKTSVIIKLKNQLKNAGIRPRTRDAMAYYTKTIRSLRTPIRKQPGFMNDTALIQRNNVRVGAVCTFIYDAKTADVLDYWDSTPMTAIISKWTDQKTGINYFSGISLHYLPPYLRYQLLIYILENTNGSINLNNAKVNIDYEMIKTNLSKFRGAYKQYLVSHIRSSVMEVPLKHLDIAMALPVSTWVGDVSEQSIWNRTVVKGY
jgi:hypothetical protein